MGARWDDLRGDTLSMKALSLVEWAERHALLYELMHAIIKQRNDIDWE